MERSGPEVTRLARVPPLAHGVPRRTQGARPGAVVRCSTRNRWSRVLAHGVVGRVHWVECLTCLPRSSHGAGDLRSSPQPCRRSMKMTHRPSLSTNRLRRRYSRSPNPPNPPSRFRISFLTKPPRPRGAGRRAPRTTWSATTNRPPNTSTIEAVEAVVEQAPVPAPVVSRFARLAPPGHRRRQPEGRRWQDHHHGEPGRLPGRPGYRVLIVDLDPRATPPPAPGSTSMTWPTSMYGRPAPRRFHGGRHRAHVGPEPLRRPPPTWNWPAPRSS